MSTNMKSVINADKEATQNIGYAKSSIKQKQGLWKKLRDALVRCGCIKEKKEEPDTKAAAQAAQGPEGQKKAADQFKPDIDNRISTPSSYELAVLEKVQCSEKSLSICDATTSYTITNTHRWVNYQYHSDMVRLAAFLTDKDEVEIDCATLDHKGCDRDLDSIQAKVIDAQSNWTPVFVVLFVVAAAAGGYTFFKRQQRARDA